MKLVTWNVNGIRSCVRQGFVSWLSRSGADVVALQEVRAREEDLPDELRRLRNWHVTVVAAEQPGYSGVALLSRTAPDEVETSTGVPDFDREGRFLKARFGAITVVNSYFPSGNGKDHDQSRVPFKLDYTRHLRERLGKHLESSASTFVVGDFNIAHQEIDIARPKENSKNSGFRPEEREEFGRWMQAGWVDCFRAHHPDTVTYSWWSQRAGCRERNVGWRLDYVLASPAAAARVNKVTIHTKVRGSDHCPVSVETQLS